MSIAAFLRDSSVDMLPVPLDVCDRFGLTLPHVAGWRRIDDARFPHATAILVDDSLVVGGFAPNALVLVSRLGHPVDANQLLSHGFEDSSALPEWAELHHDRARFCGFPSATIGGRYRGGTELLFATTRYVVVDHIVDQYLIQMTITVLDVQRPSMTPLVTSLLDGLRVDRNEFL